MKRWILLALFAAMSVAALPGQAAGLVVIYDSEIWPGPTPRPRPLPLPYPLPPPVPPPRPYLFAPLEVNYHKVNVRIADQVAITSIEQEFYNPNPQRLEGMFLLPVPRGAHLDKFTLEIDGKQVVAELLTADKARGIYEDIVRKMKDPALLEYAGRDMFKVRLFPIEPHGKRRVTLSYSQLLKSDAGLLSYTYPLSADKFSARPIKSVSVKVELESKRPLKSIYSPSHRVDLRRQGNKATLGFEAAEVRPDTDFQLFFTQEEGEIGVNLLTHKTADEEGHFLLLASPGAEVKEKNVAPKDVAFVLDTSGSMAGAKLEQAKKALLFCVENLNPGDRFEILRFSTEVEPLFDQLADASKANRVRAGDFIKELKAIGGTAIDDALRKALALRPDYNKRRRVIERPFIVIFLTDGQPTVGLTDTDQIVANVAKNGGGTRVFCFGIGTDVNTHLLDKITEETKAFSQYVLPEEDIEVKVSNFVTKIKEPALMNVKITFPEGVRATQLYPAPLPDLFKGDQLVLAGVYSGKGSGKIIVEGTVNGTPRKFSYDVNFSGEAAEHEFIPRLWATRRVGYLLDEIRLRGESKELRDEVTDLARKYGIVTPYTAYLIVEDEKQRGVPENRRSMLQLERDPEARGQAARFYEDFKREKAGDSGVAGARASLSFKQAESAADAVKLNSLAAERANGPLMKARPASPGGLPAVVTATPAQQSTARIVRYTEQSRFVAGKNFYQNGAQWIDADAQKLPEAKRVCVQFNSPEYYDLIAKNPKALAWFSVGKNVQLLLNGTVYDVVE